MSPALSGKRAPHPRQLSCFQPFLGLLGGGAQAAPTAPSLAPWGLRARASGAALNPQPTWGRPSPKGHHSEVPRAHEAGERTTDYTAQGTISPILKWSCPQGRLEKNQSGLAWGPQCFTPKGESSINRAAAGRERRARVGGAARPNLWKLSQGVAQEIRGPWGG